MAGYFTASTFREIGSAATPQNLFTIENIDSTKLVYIRKLILQTDETVALTSVAPLIKVSRATGVPSGGTTLAKGLFDTSATSNANTICRGSTASDGGANSGPTATAGDVIWEQFIMRIHTAVGQILTPDQDLLPATYIAANQFILRQNQALLVQIVAAAGASNPATNHYAVCCAWEEN
jgi:hypothetical protein